MGPYTAAYLSKSVSVDLPSIERCSIRYIFKATKQGALKVTLHNFLLSDGRRNVLPIKSLGSKVGIGLDPDGFSSSLDLMKTVGAFGFGGGASGDPSGDP